MTNLRAHVSIRRRFMVAGLLLASTTLCLAQNSGEKTFASPGDAVLAFYNAAKANDTAAMNAIFGSNAQKILNTGDSVADKRRHGCGHRSSH